MSRRKLFIPIVVVVVVAVCVVLAIATTAQARTVKQVNGAIAGIVLNSSGKAMAGVTVEVWKAQVTFTDDQGRVHYEWGPYVKTDGSVYSAQTSRSGAYTLSVPAGIYRVWFVPADTTLYCKEAFPDAAVPSRGIDVRVTSAKTTSRVSVVLDGSPRTIIGHVKAAAQDDPRDGIPQEGIVINLGYQGDGIVNTEFGTVFSGADGYFQFTGLKPFDWGVWINGPAGGNGEWTYEWLTTDEYSWMSRSVWDMDARLQPFPGWRCVVGRIVDEQTGLPIEGIVVQPREAPWNNTWNLLDFSYSTPSDADGYFTIYDIFQGEFSLYEGGDGYYSDGWFASFGLPDPGGNTTGDENSADFLSHDWGQTIHIGEWRVPAGGGG